MKSTSSIDISGYLYVQNFTLHITGAYASAVHFLTLQSRDTVVTSIYGQNFTGVEINVFNRSGSFMEGSVLFKNGGPRKTKCSTELRRYAG